MGKMPPGLAKYMAGKKAKGAAPAAASKRGVSAKARPGKGKK